MKTYDELHQLFPSRKLVRKLLEPGSKPNVTRITHMQECIQAALLVVLENYSLPERVHLTYQGKCILHPYWDDAAGKERQIAFRNEDRQRYVTRKLAKQLREVVRDGIDVQGQGCLCVENGDVVYVPKPPPTYGNVILLHQYFTFSK